MKNRSENKSGQKTVISELFLIISQEAFSSENLGMAMRPLFIERFP